MDFEPILNQDGARKNDCERNAAKRLCEALNTRYPGLKIILVKDALYANAPHIRQINGYDWRYILKVKPDSHKSLERQFAGRRARAPVKYSFSGDSIIRISDICIRRRSDYETIHVAAALMDRRWQFALDCLEAEEPPFSKGAFVAFRTRLIEHQMDWRLLERTIEIVAASQAFWPRNLRTALDSSPLWGAGRVEDTYNLLGHALRKALSVIAPEQGPQARGHRSGSGGGVGRQLEPQSGARSRLGRPRRT